MVFAVIDLETTGILPERSDRIVEAAVVLVDRGGNIESEWSTLLNPHRDIGATRIHGLTAADLFEAPEFYEVADEILALLAERVVVAHNASFDMRFLHSELQRAGYYIPDQPVALCSMKWAGALVGPAKLKHACEALGVPIHNAHSALGDARATAMLLPHLMQGARRTHLGDWNSDFERSREFMWPPRQGRPNARLTRRGEQVKTEEVWLDKVLQASWIPGLPEDQASYLLVLERALLDRVISRNEAEELVAAARGLSGATITKIHSAYLAGMAQEALADGVVTSEERADLLSVAEILALTIEDVDAALSNAEVSGSQEVSSFALAIGDRVVFTGDTERPRDEWVTLIVGAGLASGGVTKSTKVVVAEDIDSMSGKAAKARQYGIPVINEQAFERLFEAYCAARRG